MSNTLGFTFFLKARKSGPSAMEFRMKAGYWARDNAFNAIKKRPSIIRKEGK